MTHLRRLARLAAAVADFLIGDPYIPYASTRPCCEQGRVKDAPLSIPRKDAP